ncbi:MAG TPA: WD40 repeat domain-containing protein [Gemmataceae bacterium]
MRFVVAFVLFGGLFAHCLPAAGQQPTLSPVAPASARLDQTLAGLDGPGFALAHREDGDSLFAACEHSTIHYWTKDVWAGVRKGAKTPYVLKGHEGPVIALACGTGATLASAGADGKVLIWNLADGSVAQTLAPEAIVRALAFSPDGALLAGGGDGALVYVWEAATGKLKTKLEGHTDWIWSLAFCPDGNQLASGSSDGSVIVWDVPNLKKQLSFSSSPPPPANTPPSKTLNTVLTLAFSPDGKQLALGGSDMQIHVVNPADGKFARSLPGHTSSVTGVAFHPDGKLLVSGSKDRTVRLWDSAGGQALKTLEGHTAWVQGVAFLAQGTRVASVSADQTVRMWDLSAPPK